MSFFNSVDQNEQKRLSMVESQLKARGIASERVLEAMQKVSREQFVPDRYKKDAYNDSPLPIGSEQTISQPYMVAIMTECLDLQPNDKVLEIGTGSGYQTAVLLEITPRVYTIERLPELAEKSKNALSSAGYTSFQIRVADGSCGWPEEAPFDAIIVTSAAPEIPTVLKEQLADGGRIVVPVGPRHMQTLYKVKKEGHTFKEEKKTQCTFVPLIGKYGWNFND